MNAVRLNPGRSTRALGQKETARLVVYLGALLVAMVLIVLYLAGIAIFQANFYYVYVAMPFTAGIVVVLSRPGAPSP